MNKNIRQTCLGKYVCATKAYLFISYSYMHHKRIIGANLSIQNSVLRSYKLVSTNWYTLKLLILQISIEVYEHPARLSIIKFSYCYIVSKQQYT